MTELLLKTDLVQTSGIARLQKVSIVHRVKKPVLKATPPPPTFKTSFCFSVSVEGRSILGASIPKLH